MKLSRNTAFFVCIPNPVIAGPVADMAGRAGQGAISGSGAGGIGLGFIIAGIAFYTLLFAAGNFLTLVNGLVRWRKDLMWQGLVGLWRILVTLAVITVIVVLIGVVISFFRR